MAMASLPLAWTLAVSLEDLVPPQNSVPQRAWSLASCTRSLAHRAPQMGEDSSQAPRPHAVAMGSLPVAFWSFQLAWSLALALKDFVQVQEVVPQLRW